MSVGHGIFPFILAGSVAYPHVTGLSSVNDEHCVVREVGWGDGHKSVTVIP